MINPNKIKIYFIKINLLYQLLCMLNVFIIVIWEIRSYNFLMIIIEKFKLLRVLIRLSIKELVHVILSIIFKKR